MATNKKNQKDTPELSEREAEALVYQAFERSGAFLPRTPEEVAAAEAELDEGRIELPASLRDPFSVLDGKARPCVVLRFPARPDPEAVENMACAARHGSDIPPEVLAKMDADEARADAERGAGDD